MRIYIAGCSRDPAPCLELRKTLLAEGHIVTSSWLDLPAENPPAEEVIWTNCLNEIQSSNVMVILVPQSQHLRGALFEAGFATALRIPKIVVNPWDRHIGTWVDAGKTYLVSATKDLIEVLRLVK